LGLISRYLPQTFTFDEANIVILANARIQKLSNDLWTPAFAGVTKNSKTDFSKY